MNISPQVVMFFLTFILSSLSGPGTIRILKKIKAGQTVRDDGPKTHLKKTGTPTMGGVIFLIPITLMGLFWSIKYGGNIITYILVTLGFGAIGFADDFLKVRFKKKDGLSPKAKMAGLLGVAAIFTWWILKTGIGDTSIIMPFKGIYSPVNISLWIYVPFTIFFLLAVTNGVNLTDGVDGLAGSVTFVIALFFVLTGMTRSMWDDSALFAAILAGGILGFLLYNVNPAKVFMGDTGSLALGGAIGALAVIMKMPWIILIVGVIYLVEALSVMIQVAYFKRTKKRIFKMAPLHHHFELLGWTEKKIVLVFVSVTLLGCFIGFLTLRFNFFI